jgi:hypothetical protein
MEQKVKETIYKNLQLDPYEVVITKWGNRPAIHLGQLIDAIFEHITGVNAIASLGRSPQTFNRVVKKLFPGVKLNGGEETWKYWLISQSDFKWCTYCRKFKLKNEFSGIERCTPCNRFNNAYNRAALDNRTPKGVNLDEIAYIYENCPEGYEVDHIIPLKGKNVSGLHVPSNLQYLTIEENRKKSNKVPQ